MRKIFIAVIIAILFLSSRYVFSENESDTGALLTVILKHNQSRNLDQINAYLEQTGFWKEFPPAGTEVISWYVVMGIGHVIILKVPPDKLRDVNIVLEKRAWGVFKTEFYPSYDFKPVWRKNLEALNGKK